MDINHFSEASASLKTVRDCLRFSVSRFNEAELFFGHGSQNAYDEAAYLILHTLNLPLDRLDPFLDARLTQSELYDVLDIIERRTEQRIPAAYLTNQAWLGDMSFYVDERVIVPRSFIAELLREQLSPWISDADRVGNVLDMCTGSGCLAILAAHAFPYAHVDAVDLSADALDVAQYNVTDYDLEDRVSLLESDMFANLDGKKYDLIISNPPYVDAPSVATLAAGIQIRTQAGSGQRYGWPECHPCHSRTRGRTPQRQRDPGRRDRPQSRCTGSCLPRTAFHLAGSECG